jgi:hypothetical protein
MLPRLAPTLAGSAGNVLTRQANHAPHATCEHIRRKRAHTPSTRTRAHLLVNHGVPVCVIEDDGVCCLQVEAHAACPQAQQEQELAASCGG